jgi:hypothetical protein
VQFQEACRLVQDTVAARAITAAIDAPYREEVFDNDCAASLLEALKHGGRCTVPLIQIPTT